MKKILFLILISAINLLAVGQTKQRESVYVKDTSELVIIHTESIGQMNKEFERGYYKVLNIDTFEKFYLIFIESSTEKNTIYSEKSSLIKKGKKLKVNKWYCFELICKDTLYNGKCLNPMQDVTYFGKYLGHELGKVYIAKNLCGLFFLNSKSIVSQKFFEKQKR